MDVQLDCKFASEVIIFVYSQFFLFMGYSNDYLFGVDARFALLRGTI